METNTRPTATHSGTRESNHDLFALISVVENPDPYVVVMTLAFAITGWLVERSVVRTTYASVEQEAKASFQAYDSLWKSRADLLASVSEILSTMSDVRAAFSTKDQATIQDTAGELWSKVSSEDAFFLVSDGRGRVIASLRRRLPSCSTTICLWCAPRFRVSRGKLPVLFRRTTSCFKWWSRPYMSNQRRPGTAECAGGWLSRSMRA